MRHHLYYVGFKWEHKLTSHHSQCKSTHLNAFLLHGKQISSAHKGNPPGQERFQHTLQHLDQQDSSIILEMLQTIKTIKTKLYRRNPVKDKRMGLCERHVPPQCEQARLPCQLVTHFTTVQPKVHLADQLHCEHRFKLISLYLLSYARTCQQPCANAVSVSV